MINIFSPQPPQPQRFVDRREEIFASQRDKPSLAGKRSASKALDMLEVLSPKRSKCDCGAWVLSIHKFCHGCKKVNGKFSVQDEVIHKQGHRGGWQKPPPSEALPEPTASNKRLLSQVDDLMKELRRRGDASKADVLEAAPPEDTAAAEPAAVPTQVEEDEDPAPCEWDLNDVEDCIAYLEHWYPATEAAALDISPEAFEKVARFYVKDLQNRLPRAPLCVRFRSEIIDAGMLKSKPTRKNWLQSFAKARQLRFVPVPGGPGSKKVA